MILGIFYRVVILGVTITTIALTLAAGSLFFIVDLIGECYE